MSTAQACVGAERRAKECGGLTVAVVIPTYGRERRLVNTIRLVLAQEPRADEVLIIDQSASHHPDTSRYLERHAESGDIRWIRQGTPNLPAARNRGLRETICDIVLFLDDEVIPGPGLIAHHRANYEQSPVDAVAGRTLKMEAPGRPARHVDHRPEFECQDFDFAATIRRENVAALLGANHSVRRATALALGGYDENFPGWAARGESDLALRLYRNNRLIVFDPRAVVLHIGAPTERLRLSGYQRMLDEWLALGSGLFSLVYAGWRGRQCR